MPLISPAELQEHQARDACVVVDCRFNLGEPAAGRQAWAEAHVPGARYAHLDEDLAAPVGEQGGRHPLPGADQFARLLARWGVQPHHLVVAYDDAGGAIAGRLWWLLRHFGHEQAAVLDGGFAAWQAAGLPVEKQPPEVHEAPLRELYPGRMPVIDAHELIDRLQAGSIVLIDVRDGQRFAGAVEPLDRVAGHVPGAVNLPLTGNVDEAGRFLAPQALRQRFQSIIGQRPVAEVALMCGSGVSACQSLVAMEHAGLAGATLYAGSWSDWISDADRPVAKL